jgi:uncharacterized DUF497 family protein
MQFEWDPEKARRNYAKHGVPFEEAVTGSTILCQLRSRTRLTPLESRG